jgi:hypothetical protein
MVGPTSSERCFDGRTTSAARPGKDNLQFLSGRGRATRCTSCAGKRSVRSVALRHARGLAGGRRVAITGSVPWRRPLCTVSLDDVIAAAQSSFAVRKSWRGIFDVDQPRRRSVRHSNVGFSLRHVAGLKQLGHRATGTATCCVGDRSRGAGNGGSIQPAGLRRGLAPR